MPKSTATANPVMQGVAKRYVTNAAGFAAGAISPVLRLGEQSGDYYVIPAENVNKVPDNLRRAPGSNYHRSMMTLADDKYACSENGHEEVMDDSESRKYGSRFNANSIATERAMSIILLHREKQVRDKVTNASVPTASPGTKWNASGSDPIGDVQTAKSSVRQATNGLVPNTMILPYDVMDALTLNADLVDRVKHTRLGVLTVELLRTLFGIPNIVVAGAMEDGAADGQSASIQDIWSDDVVLGYVSRRQDLMEPTFTRTIAWTGDGIGSEGYIIEDYRAEEIRSDVTRARENVDHKHVLASAGYKIGNALA